MNGRRVYPRADGELWLAEGDYGLDQRWALEGAPARTCRNGVASGARSDRARGRHDHGEPPSILITTHDGAREIQWHGYLERGVWRAC